MNEVIRRSGGAISMLLLLGPALSVILVAAVAGPIEQAAAGAALAILWSPLPFGIPATLTQEARDRTLVEQGRVGRALRVIPHLAVTERHRPTIASLAGWAGLLVVLPLL